MAAPIGTKNKTADVSPEEIRQTLSRVIQSRYFSHAPKKQKFVQLICDYYLQGRAAELNEYLIGYEVFEKGAGYNPSSDPVVRVGAHDVRKKLEQYYQNEGATDVIRLQIPIGTYIPCFLKTSGPTEPEGGECVTVEGLAVAQSEGAAAPIEKKNPLAARLLPFSASLFFGFVERKLRRQEKHLLLATGAVIFFLVGVVIWLISQNRYLSDQLSSNSSGGDTNIAVSSEVWHSFLANKSSTLLILSNPVVFRSVNGADPEILTKQGIKLTPEQTNLIAGLANNKLPIRSDQPMQLIPAMNMYTGIGEAIGVFRLHGLLQTLGEGTLLKQSRSVGVDDLKDHDVVLLGSVYANQWSMPLAIKENFVYGSHTSIENLAPQPGEEKEYKPLFDQRTGALLEDYALITVVPGVSGSNSLMSLSGIYSEGTQAAVEFVTDKDHLKELDDRLKLIHPNAKQPRYFQALLKARVENSFPTQIILLTVREL